jgi:phage major head subunit gpT-like protein
MKGVVTSAKLVGIDKAINTRFNQGRTRVPNFVGRLCTRIVSTNAKEAYGWINNIPGLDKDSAEVIKQSLEMTGHEITNSEFDKAITIPRTAVEDDAYGMFANVAEEFGSKGAQRPDTELISKLLASFTTLKAWTGKALFATDHALSKAVTHSNKGTKKLSAANFQTGYAVIRNAKDGAGDPLFTMADPSKVFLVVDPDYEATADSIVRMDTLSTGGRNPNYNKAQVIVIPGLGHSWFILDNSATVGGLIFQDRLPLSITANFNLTSEDVLKYKQFAWYARSRFAIGAGRPEYAYGSTGADAA